MTSGRQRNKRGHGDRLRGEILDAAHEVLVATERESAVTIRAVAREAGIAAQSCYLHFATRDALLWALYEREFERLRAELAAAAADGETPRERLRSCAQAYCAYGETEPGAYGLLFQSRGVAEHAWGDRLPGQPLVELWVGLVGETIGSATAASEAAIDLWAALHGAVTLRRDLPAFAWPTAREETVDRLLARILPASA